MMPISLLTASRPADGGPFPDPCCCRPPAVKRLVRPLPPLDLHPSSEVVGVIEVEQMNPRGRYMIEATEVRAVHVVVANVASEQRRKEAHSVSWSASAPLPW